MRVMGIEALVPRPGTSKAAPGHKIYPYLLRGLAIIEPNHVWAADITYIPMAHGFLYLVAIIDWASRAVLAWRLSNTIDSGFCIAALEEALLRHGKPKIFNTDQGAQFTSAAFTGRLEAADIAISMDGRGRFMDNIFIERLVALDQIRRSASESLCRRSRGAGRHRFLGDLLQFSPPTSGDEQPDADGGVARRHGQDRGGGEGCGYAASLGQRKRVAHIPTAETEAATKRLNLFLKDKSRRDYTLTPSPVVPRTGSTSMEQSYVHARRSAVTQITVRAKRGRLESRLLLTLIHIDHLP